MMQNISLHFGDTKRVTKADVKGGLAVHKVTESWVLVPKSYPWRITHVNTGRKVHQMLLRTRKDAFRLRDALLEVCDWDKIKYPTSKQLEKKVLKVFEEFKL